MGREGGMGWVHCDLDSRLRWGVQSPARRHLRDHPSLGLSAALACGGRDAAPIEPGSGGRLVPSDCWFKANVGRRMSVSARRAPRIRLDEGCSTRSSRSMRRRSVVALARLLSFGPASCVRVLLPVQMWARGGPITWSADGTRRSRSSGSSEADLRGPRSV